MSSLYTPKRTHCGITFFNFTFHKNPLYYLFFSWHSIYSAFFQAFANFCLSFQIYFSPSMHRLIFDQQRQANAAAVANACSFYHWAVNRYIFECNTITKCIQSRVEIEWRYTKKSLKCINLVPFKKMRFTVYVALAMCISCILLR